MKWLYNILVGVGIIALNVAVVIWLAYFMKQPQPIQTNNTPTQDSPITVPTNTISSNTNSAVTEETQNDNTNIGNTNTVTTDNADAHSCDQDTITFCSGIQLTKMNRVNCLLEDHYNEI